MTRSTSQIEAAGLALAGYTFWVLADASLKFAGASPLSGYEVIALLGLSVALWMAVLALWQGGIRGLWPKRPGPQVLRSFLDLGNNICVVVALRHLPLSIFYLLIFLAPTVTTLSARVFLHEPLQWKQAVALATGFAGVVVAIDPFRAARSGDRVGYIACLACVACFSANMVWSRRMAQSESAQAMTFFSGVVSAIVGGAAMLHVAVPVAPRVGGLLVATGLFCVLGSLCYFTALRHSSAANVSQYHYSQLVTGSALAFVLFHERFTLPMLAGAVLIVLAGVYTAAQSRNRHSTLPAFDLAASPE